jgi:hypothetical protein
MSSKEMATGELEFAVVGSLACSKPCALSSAKFHVTSTKTEEANAADLETQSNFLSKLLGITMKVLENQLFTFNLSMTPYFRIPS